MVRCFQLPNRTFLFLSFIPVHFSSLLFEFESCEISATKAGPFRNKSIVLPFVFNFQLHVFSHRLQITLQLIIAQSRSLCRSRSCLKKENNNHLGFHRPDAPSMLWRTVADSSSARRLHDVIRLIVDLREAPE